MPTDYNVKLLQAVNSELKIMCDGGAIFFIFPDKQYINKMIAMLSHIVSNIDSPPPYILSFFKGSKDPSKLLVDARELKERFGEVWVDDIHSIPYSEGKNRNGKT